jgi:restriction endonuclease S subunit
VDINLRKLDDRTPNDYEFGYVDISAVNSNGDVAEPTLLTFSEAPTRARRMVRSGDTIISTVRTYLRAVALFETAQEELICSTGFAVLSPRHSVEPRFLYYWVRSSPFVDAVVARSTGVSYPAANPSDVGDLPLALPSRPTQVAIADFLDRETERIDRLVEKKRRLIELLEEKRTALISHTVTKGLDQSVPMKDSGIAWLGEIPKHWETLRMSAFARPGAKTFVDGDWVELPYITDEGIRLIQTGNIGVGEYREQGFRYIAEESFYELQCTEVMPGDVLVCRLADPVGRACLAPELGVRMITSVDVCIVKTRSDVDARYLVYLLSSKQYLAHLDAIGRGGTRVRVSRSQLGQVRLPIPPLEDQERIAGHLDDRVPGIRHVMHKTEEQLDKLAEYRQALITAAVTGQLDVTAETPEPEEVVA